MRKRTYTIANAIAMALLWLFFFFAMEQVLDFWEKNQLFRFSAEYWRYFENEPLGAMLYLNTFFIQFNYHLWLGAAVYAGLFGLMAILLNRTLSHACQKPVFAPGWITAALFLPTVGTYGLLWVLTLILILLGAQCWQYCSKPFFRYLLQAIVTAALLWVIREYTLIACLFYIGIDIAPILRQNGKIKHYIFWPCWLGLLLSFAIGWSLWHPYPFVEFNKFFVWAYTPSSKISLFPFVFFRTHAPVLLGVDIGLFCFVSFGFILPLKKNSRRPKPLLAVGIALVLLVAGSLIAFTQSRQMRQFQKVDVLCREFRWQEALQQLNRQWERNPDMSKVSYENNLFAAQTKVALLATRQATSRLFTYPQPAFPMLFPLKTYGTAEAFVMPPYYLYIGAFGESLQLSYDFITFRSISPNTLRNLITTELILNDTVPPLNMAHLLDHTLFYRREAALYRDAERRSQLPAVQRGKKMLPKKNYNTFAYLPDKTAMVNYINNRDNPYFYEYALCELLVLRPAIFISFEIDNIRRFYKSYADELKLPRHLQEALLVQFDYSPVRFAYPQSVWGVSAETWRDYWQFLADKQSFEESRITANALQQKWGHTYWFYDLYLSVVNVESESSVLF